MGPTAGLRVPDAPIERMTSVVLGTVQLGIPYGRQRDAGVVPEARAFAVLDRAWALGIRAFDTAEAYGDAANRLQTWLERRGLAAEAQVITKVQLGSLRQDAERALARFAAARQVLLLSHGVADGAHWESLRETAQRMGRMAGQSVYTSHEVARVSQLPGVARVQAPGNVLDDGALIARGTMPLPLDVRSVFLQGVLLDSPEVAERRVRGGGRLADAVRVSAEACEGAAAPLLVAAVLATLGASDRVVLGADDPAQLDAIVLAATIDPEDAARFARLVRATVGVVEPAVLDPRTW